MPFIVYERSSERSKTTLVRHDTIALGGKHGPFAAHVRQRVLERGAGDLSWELSEQQMLKHAGYAPDRFSIVIDLKPKDDRVSLYRLLRVWGLSHHKWTVVVFQLKPLFVDQLRKRPKSFKRRFVEPGDNGELVHEFLYLQGGTASGSWGWGRSGSVNAALLWPDTYKHFHKLIQRHI